MSRSSRRRPVTPTRPPVSRVRVGALAVAIALVAGCVAWRLVDLQVTPDEALAEDVGSQVREETIPAPRGEIHDRWGRVFAISLPRPSIVANPRLLSATDRAHPEVDLTGDAVRRLDGLLATEPATLEARLRSDRSFVFLERQVDPEVGEAVRALEIPGVYIDEEQRREHPVDDCSGIGVVGRVDVDQNGVSGLEAIYHGLLQGRDGVMLRQTQAGGDVRIPGGFRVVEPMEPGADLRLTLDRNIQFEAEELLAEALEAAQGDHGIAVVSDPNTGEILAMANVVRDPETGEAGCTTTNLAATWAYEPGSIMKPITFASVFEHDAWPEQYPVDVPHRLRVDLGAGVPAHFYEDRSVAVDGASVAPARMRRDSSNNGTILMAQEAGADALYSTMVDFGFGRVTGLGLHGEAGGILDTLDSHALELSNAAIGQSVAVSPLQMLLAYNALASGGRLVAPTLVAHEVGTAQPATVVSRETADTVVRMMRQVVIDGTGVQAQIPGYEVAGKTGTAWQPCDIGYECSDGSKHITASFAGIVANDAGAALSAIVVIDNPRVAANGGGAVAAPVFADLVQYALRQLRIAPQADGLGAPERVRAMTAGAPLPESDGP